MFKNKYIEIGKKTFPIEGAEGNVLDLSDKVLWDENIEILSEKLIYLSKIEHIYLINNNITDKGLKNICKALYINDNIKTIDLSYNYIEWKWFEELAKLLSITINLETLILSYNNIKDEYIDILCKNWIKNNNSLKYLYFYDNNIDVVWIKKLKDSLIINKKIKEISISLYPIWLVATEELLEVFNYRSNLNIIYQ